MVSPELNLADVHRTLEIVGEASCVLDVKGAPPAAGLMRNMVGYMELLPRADFRTRSG